MSELTLIQFLDARLSDDEAPARRSYDEAGDYDIRGSDATLDHFANWKPERVLDEVAAKRRIVERHHEVVWTEWADVRETACGYCSTPGSESRDGVDGRVEWPCPDLLDLALPYDGHEAYREEWRP